MTNWSGTSPNSKAKSKDHSNALSIPDALPMPKKSRPEIERRWALTLPRPRRRNDKHTRASFRLGRCTRSRHCHLGADFHLRGWEMPNVPSRRSTAQNLHVNYSTHSSQLARWIFLNRWLTHGLVNCKSTTFTLVVVIYSNDGQWQNLISRASEKLVADWKIFRLTVTNTQCK